MIYISFNFIHQFSTTYSVHDNLWSHWQLPATISCNNPGSTYITNCNNDQILVPPPVSEPKIAIMTYKIQTKTKCPIIVHLIVNIIFDKSQSGINYSDKHFQCYGVPLLCKIHWARTSTIKLVPIENGEIIQLTNGL